MKKSKHQEIEVQITPMLDMAFQLLTFFILTYRPAPTENLFSMNLLPAAPAIKMDATKDPSKDVPKNDSAPASLTTLTTVLRANPDGTLGRVTIEENEIVGMDQLKAKLKEFLDPTKDLPFEQALIQADPQLKYEEVMKVIDVFSSLKINKISFSEIDPSSGAAL